MVVAIALMEVVVVGEVAGGGENEAVVASEALGVSGGVAPGVEITVGGGVVLDSRIASPSLLTDSNTKSLSNKLPLSAARAGGERDRGVDTQPTFLI